MRKRAFWYDICPHCGREQPLQRNVSSDRIKTNEVEVQCQCGAIFVTDLGKAPELLKAPPPPRRQP